MVKLGESRLLKLVVSVIIALFAGIIGSVFTTASIPIWYNFLIKPPFNPPSWLFSPVWTILYILIGTSAYLVWMVGWENKEVKIALSVYGVQLVLNTLWSILFFGLQSPFLGFLGIVPLWISIVLTILLFYRVSKKAAYLLIPYILWVSFAAILNFTVWQLNPWPYGQLIINFMIFQGLATL